MDDSEQSMFSVKKEKKALIGVEEKVKKTLAGAQLEEIEKKKEGKAAGKVKKEIHEEWFFGSPLFKT